MVSVSAGTFTMGGRDDGDDGAYGASDELPRHRVTLSAYRIGKYAVTNGQMCSVLNWARGRGYLKDSSGRMYSNGWVYGYGQLLAVTGDFYSQIQYTKAGFVWKSRLGSGGVSYSMEDHPVVNVTWYGAVAFCNWLSEMEGLSPVYKLSSWTRIIPYPNGYRLPTEAERERAAAWDGSKHWIYGFKSDSLRGRNRCNCYWYNGGVWDYVNPLGLEDSPYTSPVGWFNGVNVSPNGNVKTVDSRSPVGCYDMSGNVWEWCQDWYGPYGSKAQTNPTGPATGVWRTVRGAAWSDHYYCRTACRVDLGSSPNYIPQVSPPDLRAYDVGFRLAQGSSSVPATTPTPTRIPTRTPTRTRTPTPIYTPKSTSTPVLNGIAQDHWQMYR